MNELELPEPLSRIPRDFIAAEILKIRREMDAHRQADAPTKAVFGLYLIDPDTMEVLAESHHHNHVPDILRSFGGKDQLFDGPHHHEVDESERLPKKCQASATGHSETESVTDYNPVMAQLEKEGREFLKVQIGNQCQCPRCQSNSSLGGVDIAFLDIRALENEWVTRRSDHLEMSKFIANKGGIYTRTVDPDSDTDKRNELWVDPETKPPARPLIEPIGKSYGSHFGMVENAHAHGRDYQPLDPHLNYIVLACDTNTGNVYKGEPTLPPGISEDFYKTNLQDTESKYGYVIPPLTSLLIQMQRLGINPKDLAVYCSDVPSMRDLVNGLMVNVGEINISISEEFARQLDDHGAYCVPREHNSDHPEAGKDKRYSTYNQLSALKLLQGDAPQVIHFEIEPSN